MQIHELNTINRRPTGTDYLAIDTGADTAKIAANNFVMQPLDENDLPDYGNAGQLLRTNGDGSTEWSNVGQPTDAQTAAAVSAWLDGHPEATTTVQDGSVTEAKLYEPLNKKIYKAYKTLASMVADADLTKGQIVQTLGYHNEGDGGDAAYIIRDTQPAYYYEPLDNGLYAELILTDNINVMQFGCYGDGVQNDTAAFSAAVTAAKREHKMLTSPSGKTYLLDSIVIDAPISIDLKCSTIKNNSSGYVLTFKKTSTMDFDIHYDVKMMKIDCDGGYGIKVDRSSSDLFADIDILNVGGIGLYVGNSFGIFFNRLLICGVTTNSIGINVATHDLHFTDITIIDCHTALYLDENSSSNIYTRIHAWISPADPDMIKLSKFAHIAGYFDCVFEECFIDTFQYGLFLDYVWSHISLNNCFVMLSSTTWANAESAGYLVYNNTSASHGTSRIRFNNLHAGSLILANRYPFNVFNQDRNFLLDCKDDNVAFSDDSSPYLLDVPAPLLDGNQDGNTGTFRFQAGNIHVLYEGPLKENYSGNLMQLDAYYRNLLPAIDAKVMVSHYSENSLYGRAIHPYYNYVMRDGNKLIVQGGAAGAGASTIYAHIDLIIPLR